MKRELLNYDIFPKVFPTDTCVRFTVKPLGGHAAFEAGAEHTVSIYAMDKGDPARYPERHNLTEYKVTPDGDGCIRVTHTFRGESEYYVRIFKEGARIVQLSVYAVLPDLVGRYPYMGDMHMHSTM